MLLCVAVGVLVAAVLVFASRPVGADARPASRVSVGVHGGELPVPGVGGPVCGWLVVLFLNEVSGDVVSVSDAKSDCITRSMPWRRRGLR